ncbi:MAG: DUF4087 domain-containing protein [Mesorhizobium sp.]|nr:DUF4087 domain-containing protein [Mesorhizobium sp.]
MKLAVAVAFLALAMLPARASENRCGWLVNPTPGNWWLTDRDGTWTLATQGMEASDDVMLNLPEFDENEYVASNGNYGYGCACLSVDLDVAGERIVNVYGGKTLPLSRCESDEALPPPE